MMVIGYGLCLVGYAAAPDIVFLTAFLLLLSFWYFLFLPTMKLNSFVSLEVHNDLQQLQIHQAVQMNSYWCFRIRLLTCGVCRVDLCHQATDHDEEDDDNHYEQLLSSVPSQTSKSFYHYRTWCIPFRRIRGRQRLVILVKIAS